MMKHLGSTVIDVGATAPVRSLTRDWLDLRGPEDERGDDERLSEDKLRAIVERDRRGPQMQTQAQTPAPDAGFSQAVDDRHALLGEVMSLRNRLRWVAVSECLPLDMCTVLVWITGPENVTCEEPFLEIGAYNPERGTWQCYLYGEEQDVQVSHWMALPPYPDVLAR